MNKVTKLHYRSKWFYKNKLIILSMVIQRIIRIKYQCVIPFTASIDKSVVFAHNGLGVVINASSIIDEDVIIYQNVTIGNRNSSNGPHICKNVLIGAGAIILGNIIVGEGSKIGAGAIVCDNVPPFSIVIGQKAKVVRSIAHDV